MKKYQIELTANQLQHMMIASEVVARLGMGQIDDALRVIPGLDLDYSAFRNIESILADHGMKKTGIAESENHHRILWDLYQVMRHEFFWDKAVEEGLIKSRQDKRKMPEMIYVQYDEPRQVGDEPLCKIKKTD